MEQLPKEGEIWAWGYRGDERDPRIIHYLFLSDPVVYNSHIYTRGDTMYTVADVSFIELETGVIETTLQYRFYHKDWSKVA
jgi:hypothetical protein